MNCMFKIENNKVWYYNIGLLWEMFSHASWAWEKLYQAGMAHWVMHHELGRTISSWAAHWQRWWWSISTTAWWYHEGTSVWQSEHMYVVFKKFYKEKRLMWWEQWFSWMRPSTWSSSTGGKLQLMEYPYLLTKRSRFADRGPVFGGLWEL